MADRDARAFQVAPEWGCWLEDVDVRDSSESAVGEAGAPSERGGLGAGIGAGMGAGAGVHKGSGTSADGPGVGDVG